MTLYSKNEYEESDSGAVEAISCSGGSCLSNCVYSCEGDCMFTCRGTCMDGCTGCVGSCDMTCYQGCLGGAQNQNSPPPE